MPENNIVIKVCSRCKGQKPLTAFSKCKSNKDGYKYYCKEYIKETHKPKSKESACLHSKKWREGNKDKYSKNWQTYYSKNKEEIKEKARQRGTFEDVKKRRREYEGVNRARINANKRKRRKNMKPHQILEKKCRDRFYKVIVRLKKGIKYCSPIKLIGCSLDELREYIELGFLDGMTWSNHGNGDGKWNIDHITPLHMFDLFKLEEQEKAFHYTNLRPIWSIDNFKRPENKKLFYKT